MNAPTIRSVESFKVPPRWCFVRVEDSDGLVGWGETVVAKRSGAVEGAIDDLSRNLVGSPVDRIEDNWSRMHRGAFFRGGPVLATAAAAIDQALWDIKGQRYGMPVFEFFGGAVRDVTRTYAWIGGDRPNDVLRDAEARVEQGYTAVKMNVSTELDYVDNKDKVDAVVERVRCLRERFGSSLDVAVDFHGRVHRAMTKRLINALDEFQLLWIEEPVPPGYEALLSTIIPPNTSTPICTGERLSSRWDFRQVFESGVVDVINPDVSLTGLSELIKIARTAEAYDIAVAPHSPQGPVCLAASLHACVALPNAIIVEHGSGIHYNSAYQGLKAGDLGDYVHDASTIRAVDGVFENPVAPGLGAAVDEEAVKRAVDDWHLMDADWRLPDGRLAEW